MKVRSPQASRSLGRLDMITNDDFMAPNAIDSSMISPTTDAEGAANTVTPVVPDHDVDDENRVELGRARQRQSLVVPHDHFGQAGATCEAVSHAAAADALVWHRVHGAYQEGLVWRDPATV